jgi:flavin reductase (DIM6/NTAB) family NADH-FMN oxidoreductase RutF
MSDDPVKDALRMMPYGFYAIGSRTDADENIMVANWISQVSFEPRLVSFGLQRTSHSHGLIVESRVFSINLFRKEDEEAIKPFSKGRRKKPDKLQGARYEPGPETGCPILEEAAAYLECRVVAVLDVGGDHDVVVAEVVGAGVRKPGTVDDTLSLPHLGWSYAG